MEREKHIVAGDMNVCLKITKAEPQRTLECDKGIFRTRRVVTPMRESKHPVVFKKRMHDYAFAFLL